MNTSIKNRQRAQETLNDPRWLSIVNRDAQADGRFYYSVMTTGVYCRPSCGSRLARPENVQFYRTCDEAEHAGFRPCKRCKPSGASVREEQVALITKLCRLIETSDTLMSLEELAEAVQMSIYHVHRLFKEITGLTPKKYSSAHRAAQARKELRRKKASVTEAIHDAGFHSSSRFYESTNSFLGMTPTQYRAGGINENIHFAIGECSLGALLIAQTRRGVCAILLGDNPEQLVYNLQDYFPKANFLGDDPNYEQLIATVVGFIENPALGLDLPLDIRGTAFQQRVWQALREIPAGTTLSYSEVAQKLGKPNAARAVANACASNPLAVAIPCHRVVRQDGALSGYRWGIARKRVLLERESNDVLK
ncbi:bifunctional DNA-binding transcriptional regulator/O6-methylguanine-DNA methyltransferase Ada [Legionella drancourtii]|uniref:Transcriptional regulator, AraC family n=1 Tax=Legionella drancourtii LLAP12 TaxID=658187 RepID=G9ERQ6_9GAMM|nr:bifunctional DNA-binding transcriptional regulator/O6-methylguanine-DNA methyltransferase Ada [Legionella drancourtii]EHL30069.1 transcriptional regulator, AraC family [Legionella drancourtii LLAP12]